MEQTYSLGYRPFGPFPPGLGPYSNAIEVMPAKVYDPSGKSDLPSSPDEVFGPNMLYYRRLRSPARRRRRRRKKKGLGYIDEFDLFIPYGVAFNDQSFDNYLRRLGGIDIKKSLKWTLILAAAGLGAFFYFA